jgi:hypothetical protein
MVTGNQIIKANSQRLEEQGDGVQARIREHDPIQGGDNQENERTERRTGQEKRISKGKAGGRNEKVVRGSQQQTGAAQG